MTANPAKIGVSQLTLYNPARLNDAEIVNAFVARKALFERVLADIAAEKPNSRAQHHLIVGQRGMGKSMLLARLASELRTNKAFSKQFVPLVFAEEQYTVDRLSKFWLNCLDALADAAEREGKTLDSDRIDGVVQSLKRQLAGAAEKDEAPARAALEAFLQATESAGKRPVLLVDNLQLVFERIAGVQQHALREVLMRPGSPILVGASPSLPPESQDYGAAFYDHFKIHYLRALSSDEMRTMMLKLAETTDRTDVRDKVVTHPERLKALRDLTGGNPRTVVALFFLFAEDFSASVLADLENLLDRVTPLYKARIEELSEQQQVVASAIADHWAPITARSLSETIGLPMSSVSAQLDRLEKIGFVERVEIFGQSSGGYQIAERFLNIWFLMRSASRRQRRAVEFLVRFIESFYEARDRPRLAWSTEAEAAYREAIEIDPEYAPAWNGLGLLFHDPQIGRYEEAEEAYRKAIELDSRIPYPWNNLGHLLRDHLGRYADSEAAFRKAVEIDHEYAPAWNGLGNLYCDHHQKYSEAALAFTTALECGDDESPRQNLVFLYRDFLGDMPAAKQAFALLKADPHCAFGDSFHLQEALFAAYDSNWGLCRDALAKAIKAIGQQFPSSTSDDWCRASAVLLHLNFGEELLAFLRERGDDARLRPWYEALSALHRGDRRYLQNIPVEMRATAEYYFDQIEKRLNALPEKTRRRPVPKPAKKRRKA